MTFYYRQTLAGGGGGGAVLFVIGRGCVQGYQSLTQKYNQRKTIPKNIIFKFCFKPKI